MFWIICLMISSFKVKIVYASLNHYNS